MKKFLLSLLGMCFLFTGCGLKQNVIIKVNNQEITKSDFSKAFDKAVQNSQLAQMGIDIPEDENNLMYLMVKGRIVNELIAKELLKQEYKEKNIKVTKDEIEAQREKIIDAQGGKENFNKILKQNGIKQSDFNDELEQRLMLMKLVDTVHPVKVSDIQAKQFYAKNINHYKTPDMVKASHILIMADPKEIREDIKKKNGSLTEGELTTLVQAEMMKRYKKAQGISMNLKNNPDSFAAVAKEQSDDKSTSDKGGDLGFFSRDTMIKQFSDVAFKQRPNTISGVVQTPFGFHIIKVVDRKEAGIQPYDAIKAKVKLEMENQIKVAVLEQLLNNLKAKAVIQYVDSSYDPIQIEDKMKKIQAEKRKQLQNNTKK